MKNVLLPCVLCARHIRSKELSCPFCGALQEARADTLSQLATVGVVGLALLLGACEPSAPAEVSQPPASVPAQTTPASTASTEASSISASAPASMLATPESEPSAAPVAVTPVEEPQKKPKKPIEAVKKPRNVPAYGGPRPDDSWRKVKPMYGLPALPEFEDKLQ